MELGLGIHGEPGASKGPLLPVNKIVSQVGLTSITFAALLVCVSIQEDLQSP